MRESRSRASKSEGSIPRAWAGCQKLAPDEFYRGDTESDASEDVLVTYDTNKEVYRALLN